MFPLGQDLHMLSTMPAISEVGLSTTAVELSKSVANVAMEKISAVPDRAPVSAIPSAAVDISKSLATVVAAGTNVATETGTRAITNLFGRLGGVINIASSNYVHVEESTVLSNNSHESTETKTEDSPTKIEEQVKTLQLTKTPIFKIDSFYDSLLDRQDLSSSEFVPFGDFSSTYLEGDFETLSLVSRHYRNAMEYDEKEEVVWSMLQDILLTITKEDASLGLSLILSELMEKFDTFVPIEEIDKDAEIKNESAVDQKEASDLQENDGWEDDWSDPELSGLSGDEEDLEKEKNHQVTRGTVNAAEKLVEELMKYDSNAKSVGTDISLYITSLLVLIEEVEIEPDIAFKMPLKSAFELARKYVKTQSVKCDTITNDTRASRLFMKAIKLARLYLTPE